MPEPAKSPDLIMNPNILRLEWEHSTGKAVFTKLVISVTDDGKVQSMTWETVPGREAGVAALAAHRFGLRQPFKRAVEASEL